MKLTDKGFTLVELVVVTAIFLVVLGLVGKSFNAILTQSSRLTRSESSNISGSVGLEMLRHDLTQMGFGLPSEPSAAPYAGEAAYGLSASANNSTSAPQSLNDPLTGPPRPIAALELSAPGCRSVTGNKPDDQNYTLIPCSDYLALKATSVGSSPAAQRWTYLSGTAPNIWRSSADNPASNDSVVLLSKSFSNGASLTNLVPTSSGGFSYQFGPLAFANLSGQSASMTSVYGVGTGPLRMPFNRVDYFVATPPAASQMSAACAPGTGVLYKAEVNQADGRLIYSPILDCVASMQVVLGWSLTSSSGAVDTWSNADGTSSTAASSSITIAALLPAGNSSQLNQPSIRNNLKVVKVYVLAQEGPRDLSYTSPSPIQVGDSDNTSLTYSYDIAGAGLQHYRWKLYRIVTTPKNLAVNQ